MRNFIWSFLAFFCLVSVAFSQTKNIEKGTYLSTNKGQKIKLNLLDDDKYELVFYSGGYKIQGDSLVFSETKKADESFNLTFKNDKKAKKIKIKFLDPSYYSFYIGTQNGTEEVQYQRIADIKTKADPEWKSVDVDFEIEKTDFLYLVYEGYDTDSKIYKYALPKDVSEITIKYEFDVLGDLKISGFYDKKTNELKISGPGGKDPIVFLNEKNTPPATVTQSVAPIEKQSISKWTYPGKEAYSTEDYGAAAAADSAAAVVDAYTQPKIDFKFKVENNLKDAIAATKNAKTKFLVVYSDSKNASAKADFDAFIKDQEVQVGYNMYDVYDPQYDIFNYYLATADDKKWLKANKLTDSPSVIVLNGDGDILTSAKSTLNDQKEKFNYYDDFCKKVQRANAFYTFNKVIKNKKATDADLVSAFNRAAILELPYDYDSDYTVVAESNAANFNLNNASLDKKEVLQIWKKLIEAHQKDAKPNMLLVGTILKEIKNQGFYKQFFKEDRVLNDADFLSIDYLIKHYDAIEKANTEVENPTYEVAKIGNLSTELSSALQMNSYVSQEGVEGSASQDKIISIYKKLITAGKGGFDCYKNYFAYLSQDSETKTNDTAYLKEFNAYYDSYLSAEKGNVIEKLDNMYATIDPNSEYAYGGWNSFKDYHSNLANSASWSVVLKPENSDFIKKAINWSEYSLVVTKNNPYYLDTLAQLYYKDGQKEKAIETQKKALQYSATVYEEQTLNDMKEVLDKMQNGTY